MEESRPHEGDRPDPIHLLAAGLAAVCGARLSAEGKVAWSAGAEARLGRLRAAIERARKRGLGQIPEYGGDVRRGRDLAFPGLSARLPIPLRRVPGTPTGYHFPGENTAEGRAIAQVSIYDCRVTVGLRFRARIPMRGAAARLLRAAQIADACRRVDHAARGWSMDAIIAEALGVDAAAVPVGARLAIELACAERRGPFQREGNMWKLRPNWNLERAYRSAVSAGGGFTREPEQGELLIYRHPLRGELRHNPLLLPAIAIGMHHGCLRAITVESRMDEIEGRNVVAIASGLRRTWTSPKEQALLFARVHHAVNASFREYQAYRGGAGVKALDAAAAAAEPLVGPGGMRAWKAALVQGSFVADGPRHHLHGGKARP